MLLKFVCLFRDFFFNGPLNFYIQKNMRKIIKKNYFEIKQLFFEEKKFIDRFLCKFTSKSRAIKINWTNIKKKILDIISLYLIASANKLFLFYSCLKIM